MTDTRLIDPNDVLAWMRDSFDVEAENGCIKWRHPPKNHTRMLGKEAGSLRTNRSGKSYMHIKMNKRALRRSWLIFLWVNGRWPTHCIDHINGDSLDDRATNLREATITQNSWNHKRRSKSSHTPMGVRTTKSGRFNARIKHNGKPITIGTYNTVDEAATAYQKKRGELYGEFA